jgi:hypothetical protein
LPPNLPKPPNPEWIALLDRLRVQPRSGEVNNGTLFASLTDLFSESTDVRAKSTALSAEYEKALLEKAVKWESDVKELRTQYEAKMIAELPEAKRLEAQKFLDASRAVWSESNARDAKTRAAFLERMRAGAHPQPVGKAVTGQAPVSSAAAQSGAEANTWMRDERMKAMKQDEESVRALRSLVGPEDVARFDRYNRARPAPKPGLAGAPVVPVPPASPAPAPGAGLGDPAAPNVPKP